MELELFASVLRAISNQDYCNLKKRRAFSRRIFAASRWASAKSK